MYTDQKIKKMQRNVMIYIMIAGPTGLVLFIIGMLINSPGLCFLGGMPFGSSVFMGAVELKDRLRNDN